MRASTIAVMLPALCLPTRALAFDGDRVTAGPLSLSITPTPVITEYDQPIPVHVQLANGGKTALSGSVRVRDLVDEWRVVGRARQDFNLDGGQNKALVFRVVVGQGAHSALYPIHAYARFRVGQRERIAHAVIIAKTEFRRPAASLEKPPALPVVTVPERGAFPLWRTRGYGVAWRYFDQPLVYKPTGWQGSDGRSRASFVPDDSANRGTVKRAVAMHPPWVPGAGTMFVVYHLRLPKTRPLTLTFANAIRDHGAEESPSDGVTFRVWVVRDDQPKQVFERHTDSKTWVPGAADLSEFAGQTVRLRLESHPGPKRNTTCDLSYWAEPSVVAGAAPSARPSQAARTAAIRRIVESIAAVASSKALPDGAAVDLGRDEQRQTRSGVRHGFAFRIGSGEDTCVALVQPGRHGLLDGLLGVGYPNGRAVVFDGLPVEVNGDLVGKWSSTVAYERCERQIRDGRLVVTHRLHDARGPFTLVVSLWVERAGLRIKFDCRDESAGRDDPADPRRITDLSLGPASAKASRVYYGHGYCIVEPEGFAFHSGGHNMSTSHVGFDFDTGVSLLQAVDHPPDRLEVRPDERRYALHTHMNATLTLVASKRGAFDCAIKYRDLYDKPAGGGVKRLAGRFTYDVWGGRYADIARHMARMARYGCTDAILTVHAWQRWGYDYRLPDIFPPNPIRGSLEDVQRIGNVCRKHGVLWGLHDNYIDFYPDAVGYSYEHISFSQDGTPRAAWLNRGRQAQSYRWRPDAFMPFLKRNLRLIKRALRPNHYFIDVFASMRVFDYYDRRGAFHSMLETRRRWGEAFAWIRQTLGEDAPTTSEAGHDQLTGYLDGADCQFLTLSKTPRPDRFTITMRCDDLERTPWFDAVLHDKFILHGVGYCQRYRGGRPRDRHGIVSDDYITAEVLTGHPAMVDGACWGAAAVRKYWLLHDVGRNLALQRIRGVTFDNGDIHRQRIAWDNGTTVWVNRGPHDWTVNGHVLPRYGYLVEGQGLFSAIERIGGVIVEHTRGPVGVYANARTFATKGAVKVRPVADRVEYMKDNRFRLVVRWDVQQPLPSGLLIFLHFTNPRAEGLEHIAFQGDHTPALPTEKWRGAVRTGANRTIEIPTSAGPGRYEIVIGLYDEARGRQPLLGQDRGSRRYLLGTLLVQGKEGKVTNVLLKSPKQPEEAEEPRTNLKKQPIDFGPLVTDGACRVERIEGGVRVTPLPDSPKFTVQMRPKPFGHTRAITGAKANVLDESGKTVRTVQLPAADGRVTLAHDGKAFAYELRWTAPP